MAARTDAIEHRRVQGVQVLCRPDLAGPTAATLLFRAGVVDEALPQRGLCHLVEHLALSTFGTQTYGYNGFVDMTTTGLYCEGTPEQVGVFLERACAALADLPTERGDAERRVLLTEQQQRRPSIAERALTLRYGANGFGLAAYEDFGLRQADLARVCAWAQRYYVRDNAVVWIAGRPPEHLELPLRAGLPVAEPPCAPELIPTPVWTTIESPGITVSMILPRSAGAVVLSRHLDRLLTERLRHEQGLSYTTRAFYVPLDSSVAHLLVTADALPESAVDVCSSVIALLHEVAEHGVSRAELDAELQTAQGNVADPLLEAARARAELDEAARSVLSGRAVVTLDQVQEQVAALRPRDLAEEMHRSLDSAVYLLGEVSSPPRQLRCPRLESSEPGIVAGRGYWRMLRDGERWGDWRSRLVAGQEGLSMVLPGTTMTVTFDQVRAVLAYSDGPRELIAANGDSLFVDPRDWENGQRVVSLVDQRLDASLRVNAGSSGLGGAHRRFQFSSAVLWLVLFFAGSLATAFLADLLGNPSLWLELAPPLTLLLAVTGLSARTLWRRRDQPR